MNTILLAILLGTLFGFVLHRIGATDGDRLINMLRLKDLRLMKTILFGIGVATVLIFISNTLGLLNVEHFSIKSLNIGVIIGGVIFGLGWALSGYCPGTAVSGLGAFKKDALFYLLGGVVGAFLFTQTYSYFHSLGWFEKLTTGTETLITLTPELTGLLPIDSIGGIVFGGILILLATLIPAKLNN